jgi:hypothetical protein
LPIREGSVSLGAMVAIIDIPLRSALKCLIAASAVGDRAGVAVRRAAVKSFRSCSEVNAGDDLAVSGCDD